MPSIALRYLARWSYFDIYWLFCIARVRFCKCSHHVLDALNEGLEAPKVPNMEKECKHDGKNV